MNPYRRFEVDSQKAQEGTPINIEGMVFFCRRAGAGNRRYRAAVATATLKYNTSGDTLDDKLPETWDLENKITMDAFLSAVITGWDDVDDRDDKPLPFSPDNFRELMTSCPDLWNTLRFEAGLLDNFRVERAVKIGEDLGNL